MNLPKKNSIMTEHEFDKIKTLVGVNLTTKQIQNITERSRATIELVRDSVSWVNYKATRTEQRLRRKTHYGKEVIDRQAVDLDTLLSLEGTLNHALILIKKLREDS